MPQLLALASAALYGVSDFAGGLAAKTLSPWRVTAWSQLIGVPLLLAAVAIMGTGDASQQDLLLGASAGAIGLVGLVLMYSALATGTMSVIAPIIGALGAALAVGWDIATGGSPSAAQWIGIAVSLVAVILLTAPSGQSRHDLQPIVKAIGAATAFAGFFILLSYTNSAAGLLPLVSARAVSIPIAFIMAAIFGTAALPDKRTLPLVTFTGFGDTGASLAIILALQSGPLGLTTVLSSLYPAFTVLAAIVILRERPSPLQRIGVLLAVAGALLIAL